MIQAEKQALKAKSSKDSNVSDKLYILITSVSYLKEDYKEFKNRLVLLEAQVERSSDDAKTQADEYSHEDLRMKSKIMKKTLTSSIQSPSMIVLTLGVLPIMSARQ